MVLRCRVAAGEHTSRFRQVFAVATASGCPKNPAESGLSEPAETLGFLGAGEVSENQEPLYSTMSEVYYKRTFLIRNITIMHLDGCAVHCSLLTRSRDHAFSKRLD
jgi:hypothetical protein